MKIFIKDVHKMSRSEWLTYRRKGIGGSDVSILAGINKHRSIFDLWLDKTGQVESVESESEFAHFGTVLEDVVKKEFTKRTGLKVRAKNAILQHDEFSFMLADLDGVVRDENGEMCIFESKTAIEYKSEEWEKGVPLEYQYQVQHYFAVTGYRKAYVCCLCGGNKFYIHVMYRDEEMIREIISMENTFWYGNVVPMKEPIPDGSMATTEYLNSKYRESNGEVIELPEEVIPIFVQYDQLTAELDRVKSEREAVCNQLKNYLKDNEVGLIHDRKVSWKETTSKRFDGKKLKADNPALYDEYTYESSYRRLLVA